jgi:hypothetical protein
MAIGCQRSAISGRFSALSESRSDANLSDSADFLLAISCQSSLIDFQTTLCQSQRFGMPVFFAESRWFPTTDSQFSISQHHRSQPSLLSAEKTSLCINLSWYVKNRFGTKHSDLTFRREELNLCLLFHSRALLSTENQEIQFSMVSDQ